jgi:predicted porin
MNKKINLAVAGAVLLAASAANAGIIIPAGDWTLDINGNVNAFATYADYDAAKGTAPGTAQIGSHWAGTKDANGEDSSVGLNTGLLPAWLGFTGTTRQNDIDVSWTISFQPNVSDNQSSGMGDTMTPLNRQAFLTFGDKSWGSFKLGKDLGIFASDAILSDMTLLGVGGGGGGSGAVTTLGGIGFGYIYPAWKGQVAYTTPNMNGFQATVAITNPDQGQPGTGTAGVNGKNYSDRFGIEAKASYAFNAGAATGKLWTSGASYKRQADRDGAAYKTTDYDAQVMDFGLNVNVGNAGLTAYYYNGEGVGTGLNLLGSEGAKCTTNSATNGGSCIERDSDGGYVQGTYVIPTGTKLGVAYGVNRLDLATGDTAVNVMDENNRWTVGAYHPLTKHLNLVAEYNATESKNHNGGHETARRNAFVS